MPVNEACKLDLSELLIDTEIWQRHVFAVVTGSGPERAERSRTGAASGRTAGRTLSWGGMRSQTSVRQPPEGTAQADFREVGAGGGGVAAGVARLQASGVPVTGEAP